MYHYSLGKNHCKKTAIVAQLWNKKSLSHFKKMSKTHVHALQQFDKFSKDVSFVKLSTSVNTSLTHLLKVWKWKIPSLCCCLTSFFSMWVYLQFSTMWILWDWNCELGFLHITHAKILSNHESNTHDFLAFVIWKNPCSHFLLTVFSHCRKISLILVVSKTNTCHFENYFSFFSSMFLNPDIFFQFEFELLYFIRYEKPPGTN